jgi:hypothetical protein
MGVMDGSTEQLGGPARTIRPVRIQRRGSGTDAASRERGAPPPHDLPARPSVRCDNIARAPEVHAVRARGLAALRASEAGAAARTIWRPSIAVAGRRRGPRGACRDRRRRLAPVGLAPVPVGRAILWTSAAAGSVRPDGATGRPAAHVAHAARSLRSERVHGARAEERATESRGGPCGLQSPAKAQPDLRSRTSLVAGLPRASTGMSRVHTDPSWGAAVVADRAAAAGAGRDRRAAGHDRSRSATQHGPLVGLLAATV